jgi:hypothetical protein
MRELVANASRRRSGSEQITQNTDRPHRPLVQTHLTFCLVSKVCETGINEFVLYQNAQLDFCNNLREQKETGLRDGGLPRMLSLLYKEASQSMVHGLPMRLLTAPDSGVSARPVGECTNPGLDETRSWCTDSMLI